MQQSLIKEEQLAELSSVSFLVGDVSRFQNINKISAKVPFDEKIIDFLNDLSKKIMADREAKLYPDVVTFGFWIRKSSIIRLKDRMVQTDGDIHQGRGVIFHIAPSNVPVNYAYSLVSGLVTGNINIVRLPSKDFPQVSILNRAIIATLEEHQEMANYIYLVRYNRNQRVNDILSSIADVRVIWGGDSTVEEIRNSALPPRSGEVTFADRYSLAVIDADEYIALLDKSKFADDFYNDTYLSDQNACTSPRVIVWLGEKKAEAKELFWSELHRLVKKKYTFQSIMGVNKQTSAYIAAATLKGVKILPHEDNYLVRVEVAELNDDVMRLKDNSGFFYEYDCKDILELKAICNNTRCQTIGFLGAKEKIMPLLLAGSRGVDRVVPIGQTMDFDLVWDGYNLYERFTRIINIVV